MAHKLITKVRYDAYEKHIDQVEFFINGGSLMTMLRTAVVNEIKQGISTFQTATLKPSSSTQYDLGAPVIVAMIGGVQYIKTVNDNTAKDNLGNLPRF